MREKKEEKRTFDWGENEDKARTSHYSLNHRYGIV